MTWSCVREPVESGASMRAQLFHRQQRVTHGRNAPHAGDEEVVKPAPMVLGRYGHIAYCGAAAIYDEPDVTVRIRHAPYVPIVAACVARGKERA
eukprot:276443-Pleurochrysis_carterae.AAC.4